jgi:transposase
LFPTRGKPAEAPWRLALVTVLQFAENLPDRQAADAVRSRLDVKYLLGLELTDPGFDFSVLSEFRARLVAGDAACLLLDALLDRCRALGLVKPRGKQRTDSTNVLAAIRALNRLECVGETLRQALNVLAAVVPDWLRAHVAPDWYGRYATRFEEARLPEAQAARDALATTIGADGLALLTALYGPTAPVWLREIPAAQTLRAVWVHYFYAPDAAGIVRLRDPRDMPPGDRTIESPYDPEARYHTKRTTTWTGYTVHLTETCDADRPHLVTQVATVPATTNDVEVTAPIQADLAAHGLPPAEHLLDAGYVSAQHLVASVDRGIDLVGPAPPDTSWQAAAGAGFDAAHFTIDWERRAVTCPRGKRSRYWGEGTTDHGHPFHQVIFDKDDCLACPCRAQCTRSRTRPRQLALRPRAEHVALQEARQRQRTDEFTERYKKRAGVEGTMAQGVHVCGLRRSRYRGLRRTHLQHVATGVAISLQRLDDWWTQTPRATTRLSRFAALAA